jgi:hypothetical protein
MKKLFLITVIFCLCSPVFAQEKQIGVTLNQKTAEALWLNQITIEHWNQIKEAVFNRTSYAPATANTVVLLISARDGDLWEREIRNPSDTLTPETDRLGQALEKALIESLGLQNAYLVNPCESPSTRGQNGKPNWNCGATYSLKQREDILRKAKSHAQ